MSTSNYRPRTGVRSGTTMRDQYGRRVAGEFNAATGQPLGAGDPMFKPHDWASFAQAFGDGGSGIPDTGNGAAGAGATPSPSPGGTPGWLKDAMGSVNGQTMEGEPHGAAGAMADGKGQMAAGAGAPRVNYGAPAAGPGSSVTLDSGRHAADGSGGEYSYRGDSRVQLPGGVAQIYDPAHDLMLSRRGAAANRTVTGPYGSGSVHYVHDERSAGAAADDGAGTSNVQRPTSNVEGGELPPSGHRGDGMQTHGFDGAAPNEPAPEGPVPSAPPAGNPAPWLNDAVAQVTGQAVRGSGVNGGPTPAPVAQPLPLPANSAHPRSGKDRFGNDIQTFEGGFNSAVSNGVAAVGGGLLHAGQAVGHSIVDTVRKPFAGAAGLIDQNVSGGPAIAGTLAKIGGVPVPPAKPASNGTSQMADGQAGTTNPPPAVAQPAKPTAGPLSFPMKAVPWMGKQLQGLRPQPKPLPVGAGGGNGQGTGANAGQPIAGVMALPKLLTPWLRKGARSLQPQPALVPRGPRTGPASLPNAVLSSYA